MQRTDKQNAIRLDWWLFPCEANGLIKYVEKCISSIAKIHIISCFNVDDVVAVVVANLLIQQSCRMSMSNAYWKKERRKNTRWEWVQADCENRQKERRKKNRTQCSMLSVARARRFFFLSFLLSLSFISIYCCHSLYVSFSTFSLENFQWHSEVQGRRTRFVHVIGTVIPRLEDIVRLYRWIKYTRRFDYPELSKQVALVCVPACQRVRARAVSVYVRGARCMCMNDIYRITYKHISTVARWIPICLDGRARINSHQQNKNTE